MNITYNMIEMLPLFSLYLMKRNEKSVRCWKHDQVFFSKVQRGVKKKKRLRSALSVACPGRRCFGGNVSASEQLLCRRDRNQTKSPFGAESSGLESASVSGDRLS